MSRQSDVLLVDGYNIIGAWPELERLKESNLEEARDRLLDLLADYQGYTGHQVYVVFDAHQVPGSRSAYKQHKLTVVFTKEKETADECIERLVTELKKRSRHIYVATSDSVEQHVAFGKGALRISARELELELQQNRREIDKSLRSDSAKSRNTIDAKLSLEMRTMLERMRRGE
ncbi:MULTISPECIES: NYN domain-containing protein [Paenibacillus]|uniref:NYN domain-containing protein n=1 Tax=Paenibacillus TaxID=44249 RepID=UPI00038FF789|nr:MULTISPECIES: NYN domain-containing protein [Paenibacillus]KKC48780.1 RNA-binding protein [Paenibacillus sp. D9]